MRVLVLNGPNLGRLGRRQPEIYGHTTHAELAELCRDWGRDLGLEVKVRQTNHEGELLDWLNQAADDETPVVLNAAAWSHYSYALLDACAQLTAPLVEVHISDPKSRPEEFRHHSVVTAYAAQEIVGQGIDGYRQALAFLAARSSRLMPRLHALELRADAAADSLVRADWARLREAGLPSMADHTKASNAPHLTLVAAPVLTRECEALAVDALTGLLPVGARPAGLVVLGRDPVTVARLVEVTDDVTAAVMALRRGVPDVQHPGWLPHLTLARRLPRADLARVFDVLGHEDAELGFDQLVRWDPEAGEVRRLGT